MTSWLGKAAVLWVLDEAPDVPTRLVSTLLVFARYAGEDGRGAHPSAQTVASHTRKSKRNAEKDIAELRCRGLLLPGDQRIVASIRGDRRPFVYDLPMPRTVAQDTPWRERTVADDTPSSTNGPSQEVSRTVAEGTNGPSHATDKEVLKTSGRGARDRASAQSPPRATPTPPPPSQMCIRCGGYGHTQAECWR